MQKAVQAKLSKEFLGLLGEYAVAGELCRRGVYAQLTLGHHKQTDILVETERRVLRVSAKAKQGNEWPSVSGLYRMDDYLVLVDLKGKSETERPEFYILDLDNWKQLVTEECKRRPNATVDVENRFTYPKGWKGLNVRTEMVVEWKDQWHKIVSQIPVESGGIVVLSATARRLRAPARCGPRLREVVLERR
jgi:hypothetical protein